MSNVSDILTAAVSSIQTVLGSDWKELKYIYDPEKNDYRAQSKGFGFGVSESNTVAGITKAVTVDQGFFLLLTERFHNRKSDVNEREAISNLYNAKELIDKEIFQKKIDIPDVILVVQSIETEEPVNPSDGVVLLRSNYVIKHRCKTN